MATFILPGDDFKIMQWMIVAQGGHSAQERIRKWIKRNKKGIWAVRLAPNIWLLGDNLVVRKYLMKQASPKVIKRDKKKRRYVFIHAIESLHTQKLIGTIKDIRFEWVGEYEKYFPKELLRCKDCALFKHTDTWSALDDSPLRVGYCTDKRSKGGKIKFESDVCPFERKYTSKKPKVVKGKKK